VAVRLSVVIPAYNEERRIGKTLDLAEAYLATKDYASEIIVVVDGSEDATAEIVRTQHPNVRLINYTPNRGKGYAVKTGIMAAQGECRLFTDADGSTPIEEIDRVWPLFKNGADVVIGSRSLPQSNVSVRQHPLREGMGRAFNLIVKTILGLPYIDTQCGFKAFSANAAQIIFTRQRRNRFSFDAELIFIARKHGLRIEELPVSWMNSPHSRVKIVRDSLDMLRGVLRVRLSDIAGKYK
jgi:dolichyl-phosphate beta-glucosyltransferase